jgi:hypothetical protein
MQAEKENKINRGKKVLPVVWSKDYRETTA